MDKRKRGILYWLRVVFLIMCIGFMCVRCASGFGITAYAAPSDHPNSSMVTLTPAQTLALYGTTINALIRLDNSMSTQTPIQFTYYDTTLNYGFLADGGGFSSSGIGPQSSNSSWNDEVNSFCRNSTYLIYRADPYQWGNVANYGYGEYRFQGDYSMLQNMISQGAANPVECHIPFSISLSDIAEFKSAVFYPTQLNQPPNFTYTWYQYNRITLLTDIANITDTSIPGNTVSNVWLPWTILMPLYGYDGQQTLDETRTGTFSGFYVDLYEGNDETFDLTGFTIDAYAVSSINPVYGDYDIWLLISCPTIVAVNDNPVTTSPPVVTTAPATGISYPLATMPPAYTDTPQDILNQNLIINNYKLDLIIGQLNLIYNKLNGELGLDLDLGWDPDLQDGLTPVFYGTDLQNQMNQIIASQTTYTLPEINGNNNFVRSAFAFIWDIPFVAVIGTFTLAVSIASWIIFRGRGGG